MKKYIITIKSKETNKTYSYTREIECIKRDCIFYKAMDHCIGCKNTKIIKETWKDKENNTSNGEK